MTKKRWGSILTTTMRRSPVVSWKQKQTNFIKKCNAKVRK